MKNVWEVLVVVMLTAVIALAIFFFGGLVRAGIKRNIEESARNSCANNLSHIAKACTAHQEGSGEFFPAFWDGKRSEPMKSLAVLYPSFLDNPRFYRCPVTEDRPEITATTDPNGNRVFSLGPVDTDKKCSYFYDELTNSSKIDRIRFQTKSDFSQALACDADGRTWLTPRATLPPYPANWARKPRKPNHDYGQNVMYFDGRVKWMESVYSGLDPNDNIFCPTGDASGPWDADTDAYLWDGVNARPMEMK